MNEKFSRQVEMFLNQANYFFATQEYDKARDIYADLHPTIDCSDRIRECDFHISLEIGDEYFIEEQYSRAIEEYEQAIQLNVDNLYVEERIGISKFCEALKSAHHQYEKLMTKWEQDGYAKSAKELTGVLNLYNFAKQYIDKIQITDADAQAYVEKKLKGLEERHSQLTQGIASYHEHAVQLMQDRDYFSALGHFEDIHPAIDCTKQINTCQFHLAVDKGDKHLYAHQYEKAISYYEVALVTDASNDRIIERLGFCEFALIEQAANQQYDQLTLAWSKGGKRSVKDLAKTLKLYESAKKLTPHIKFLNQEIKSFVAQSIKSIEERMIFLEEGIQGFRKKANQLFIEEKYEAAKQKYAELQPIIDVSEQVRACNFHLAVKQGDDFLASKQFDKAAHQYRIAESCEIDNQLIATRKAISEFFAFEQEATQKYKIALKKWDKDNNSATKALLEAETLFVQCEERANTLQQQKHEFSLQVDAKAAEIANCRFQIAEKLKSYQQLADQLFNEGAYLKARAQYLLLADQIDIEEKVRACDFRIELERADQLLLKKDYGGAETIYEGLKKFELETGLLKERRTVTEYGQFQNAATQTIEIGLNFWKANRYEEAIGSFKKALNKFKNAQINKPTVQLGGEPIELLVEDIHQQIEKGIEDVKNRLNKHYHEADQLFGQQEYIEAKKQYESLPITPDSAAKIKACDFYIQLKNGDSYLLNHAFQDASTAYSEAKEARIDNEKVGERLLLAQFCSQAHIVASEFITKKLDEVEEKQKQQNWRAWLGGIFSNKEEKIPEKKEQVPKSNVIRVNELRKILDRINEVNDLYPAEWIFIDNKLITFAEEKKRIIDELNHQYGEELSGFFNGADKLFANGQYLEARKVYSKLYPAIDCFENIVLCDFNIDMEGCDALLLEKQYEEAQSNYEKLHKYEINQQLIVDRVKVTNFCLLERTADTQFQIGSEEWKAENFDKAAALLQKSRGNMEEAKSLVENLEIETKTIQQMVDGKLITLQSRLDSINRRLKDYAGDNQLKAANEFFEHKEYAEAKRIYEDLHPAINCSLKIKTCNFFLAIQKGDRQVYESNFKEAQKFYDEAQKLEVNAPLVHERKLILQFCQEARAAYEHYDLGLVKWQIKNFDDAVSQFEDAQTRFKQARRMAPEIQYPDNGMNIFLEEKLKVIDERIDEMKWKLENYQLNSYYRLANEYLKEKSYQQAREQYEKVLEIRPDLEKVIDKIEQINELLENKAAPFVQRADELFQEGVAVKGTSRAKERFEKAKALYLKALDINPSDYLRRCVRQCGRAIAKEEYGKNVEKLEMNASAFLNIKSLYIPVPDLSDKLGTTEEEIDGLLEKLRKQTAINQLDVDAILGLGKEGDT